MGFDPQNASQPIVNVHKRTTKVNFSVAIAVVVFILIGIGAMLWVSNRAERGEPVREEVTPRT
ncbi:hypothetical protein [Oleiharenicola lentus]|uniref:hypothetical protein n=1 Tax=Oleiharenicola lentus TaxID=2508720 RepID=UPI003F680822